MDRNRDLTDAAAANPEPGASSGHVHRGLAQVDMGVSTVPGGPEAPAPLAPDGQGARGIRTRLYQDGALVKENFPADDISDYLEEDADCVVWLDLSRPTVSSLPSWAGSSACTHWPSRTRWTKRNGPRSTATRPICSCRPTPRCSTRDRVSSSSHEIAVFITQPRPHHGAQGPRLLRIDPRGRTVGQLR